MRFFFLIFLFLTANSSACQDRPPKEQKRIDRADIEVQAELVESLAGISDSIFIGEVIEADLALRDVRIDVKEIILGNAQISVTEWQLPARGISVACRPSQMFHNVFLHVGRTYIFYAEKGELLRAGWIERSSLDVSLNRELQIIERVQNDT
jgi:hypothetical protein